MVRSSPMSRDTSPHHEVLVRLLDQLDDARRARGESKADLARGAGLSEPAVRRLFSGANPNPTVKTLDAIAEHLGLALTFERSEASEAPTLEALRRRADEIGEIVAAHGGRNVRVFGSVARGDAGRGSDVDLLVDLDRGVGLFGLSAMEIALEQLLGCPVDVVTSGHDRMAHIHEEAIAL